MSKNKFLIFSFFFLIFIFSKSFADINISEKPLFLSSEVKPNVLILLDNSGSMNQLIKPKAYDKTFEYDDWTQSCYLYIYSAPGNSNYEKNFYAGLGKKCHDTSAGLSSDALTPYYTNETGKYVYPSASCPKDYVLGRKVDVYDPSGYNYNVTTKCIKIPDPATVVDNVRGTYIVNYVNYLFSIAESSSTTKTGNACFSPGDKDKYNHITCTTYEPVDLTDDPRVPDATKMIVARNVAKDIIIGNKNLDFGLATFNDAIYRNSGPGGRVIAGCGSSEQNLLNKVSNVKGSTSTPLAETFYEVTRYFRGMSSYYNKNVNYNSPIKYRCQKNFVIVLTDGSSTYDSDFPNYDPDAGYSLPDWDGLSPYTTEEDYPNNIPRDSDGFHPNGNESKGGYNIFLDDLAKFGYDIDMMPNGNDITGAPFSSSGFGIRNLTTYTIGFDINVQELNDAARKGGGQYYLAGDQDSLIQSLNSAIADIGSKISSASSVATNSTRLATDTKIFQAKFKSNEWVGDLLAFDINSDGSVASAPNWSAKEILPAPQNRKIFSMNGESKVGINLEWNNLSDKQKNYLNTNFFNEKDNLGQKRLSYIKGYDNNEIKNGGQFRNRSTPLGDIINSDPYFVSQLDYHFETIPSLEGDSYTDFRKSASYVSRPGVVYIASNDGMLHAFDSETGTELFGYIPLASYPRLSVITSQTFAQNHKYINDGSPNVVDAYYNNKWHTVLLGSTGAGGKGFYALNVTSPKSFGSNDIMWEFSNDQDEDMGYTISQGSVVRTANGKWVALLSNGYDSSTGAAALFIIDVETGDLIRKIHTGVSGDNGLSSVLPVDINGDKITDYVYAGDLKGNMWKFDLTSSSAENWQVSLGGQPLFKACSDNFCNGDNYQPITSRPEAILNPGNSDVIGGGIIVLFGTGRYFSVDDNVVLNAKTQSFYGIYDRNNNSASKTISKDNLLRQNVLGYENIVYKGQQTSVRITSQNRLTQASLGWYIDLPIQGEKQVSRSLVRNGRVIFSTLIPNTEACQYGGNSWLMELEALSGSRLSLSPFDLDENKKFDISDKVNFYGEDLDVSGIKIQNGIIKTPTVVSKESVEFKYTSSTSGEIIKTIESGELKGGRESWIQIR